MFRIAILLISVLWATLLLISWGGSPATAEPQQASTIVRSNS